MMKNKLFATIKFLMISTAALIFASCEIGLGDAVDTSNPTVEIKYPPKNAVIRDSFLLSGICDDDISVTSVRVTVTNSTTKKNYGPYEATLADDNKTWSLLVNKKIEGQYDAFNEYKQWEFPDGDYIVSAVSYDKVKNTSQEASIPLSVDNTAPVLLVSKPLAIGDETASVYGRTLNIIGDISEAHEATKLTFYYNEYNEQTKSFVSETPQTLEITGFGTMSSDSPLTIAKLDKSTAEAAASTLTQNYEKIYGQTIDINNPEVYGKKLYYCGFLLEDNAKLYQNAEAGVTGSGNQTNRYYILSDEFNEKLFNEDTYSLNARNLMLLLNGQSSYSKNEIAKITEVLSKDEGSYASSTDITAAESSKFSIDPKNNPVWLITNFEEEEGTFTTYELGSAVPLVLKAGGDGYAIDKSSIEIKLYHLGSDGVPETIDDMPYLTLIKKGEYEDGKLKDALNKEETELVFLDKNGNPVPGDVGLRVNHFYEFKISGKDVADNPLESEKRRYGFKRYSSFAAPRIMFESGEGYFTENEYYSGKQLEQNGIKIKGKIITASKDIEIESKDKIKISGLTVTDTSSNADVSAGIQYDYVIESLTKLTDGYSFTAKITKKAGAVLTPAVKGSYRYKIGFIAEDSLSAKNEAAEFEFKVDSKEPEILKNEITVTPTVVREGKSYVNGTITVKGNASDVGSGFDKLSYSVGNSTPVVVTGASSPWSFTFDTTTLTDEAEHILNICAEDKVGNKFTIPYTINVKQSTDTPVISFTNAENIFTKTSNTLIGTVTDDDGLKKVTASSRKTSPDEEIDSAALVLGTLKEGTSSYSINAKLPDSEGEYEVSFNVEDVAGLATGKTTKTITVKKDNGAPDFRITSPNATKDTYYKDSVNIKGTVKDGSGIAVISRQLYKVVTAEDGTETETASGTPVTITAGTETQVVAGNEWTDTIPKAAVSGVYKVVYTSKDKYNQTVQKDLVFSMDIEKPTVKTVSFDGEAISDKWYKKNSGEFSVLAEDESSAVAEVAYSKDGTTWINMAAPDANAVDAIHKTLWTSNINFEGSGLEKKLYIKATDLAGNESEIKEYTLHIDLTAPELTVEVLDKDGNLAEGTLYVNGKNNITVRGTCSDDDSGMSELRFKIGNQDITEKVSVNYYTDENRTTESKLEAYSEEKAKEIKAFSAVVDKTGLASGMLTVIGPDLALNEAEEGSCTIILDNKIPEFKDVSLIMKKVENENEISKAAYKKPDTNPIEYYIRNTKDGKLTISGMAADNIGIEKVMLSISGKKKINDVEQPANISEETTDSSWSFADIDLSSWTGDAAAILTAIDKVGNVATLNLTIKCDETEPEIITGECPDNRYTFRGAQVIKYNNLHIGQGRYSQSTYGRITSIDFTVYLKDTESGLAKLEYKLFSAGGAKDVSFLKDNFDTNPAEDAGWKWAASGSFTLTQGQIYKYYDSNSLEPADEEGYNTSGTGVKATASISGFKPGSSTGNEANYLLLRPVDNCGNIGDKADMVVLAIHVDQTAPVVVASSSDRLTNGTSPISMSGAVYDVDAGLKALRVIIDGEPVLELNKSTGNSVTNEYGTFSYTGYAPADPVSNPVTTGEPYDLKHAPSYATWNLTLTPTTDEEGWFKKLPENPVVAIEAEDWAEYSGKGNIAPNPTKVAVLKIDTEDPVVSVLSPATSEDDPSQIYGENTIQGTSSDVGSAPAKLELYYSKEKDYPQTLKDEDGNLLYTPLPDYTLSTTGTDPVNVSQLYNFTFEDIDFYNYIDSDKKTQKIWILVVATDEAGNTSEIKPVPYIIDRDKDRPTLKIDDVDLGNNMSGENPFILKEKSLTVNVTDDDGIVKEVWFRTKKGSAAAGNWQKILTNSDSGSFDISDEDGAQSIEFKVIDNKNREFSPDKSNPWEKVYVEDAADTPNIYEGPVHVILDLKSPEVKLLGISTKENPDPEKAEDWTEQKQFKTILGGDTKKIQLKLQATDEGSGIAKVEAEVKVGDRLIKTTDGKDRFTCTKASQNIYTVTIPCDDGDGLLTVKLIATDKADREDSKSYYFDIDNTKPVISIVNPQNNSKQSGSISVIGTVDESVKLWYALSPIAASPISYKSTTEFSYQATKAGEQTRRTLPTKDKKDVPIEPAQPLTELCSYKQYDENSITTFNIQFDDDNTSPDHTAELNKWLINLGISTSVDIENPDLTKCFDDYVTLYLHIMAVDEAGNKSELTVKNEDNEYEPFKIVVNPQGERPTVEFTNPKTDKPTLGGRINVMGTADGKHTIEKVYMQIECEGEDTTWKSHYEFKDIPTLSGQQGIEIDVNGGMWNQWINESLEFNPEDTGSQKKITLRVYAYDSEAGEDGLLSSAEVREINIDKDVPVIDPVIKLVQWKNEAAFDGSDSYFKPVLDEDGKFKEIEFTEDKVKALDNYEDEMFVAGKWYVVGAVTDDSGIGTIKIGGESGTELTESFSNGLIKKKFPEPVKDKDGNTVKVNKDGVDVEVYNYVFCFPIGSKDEDGVGVSEVEFYAKDNGTDTTPLNKSFTVNYDNKAPGVIEITQEAVSNIQNEDGFFTFGSVASEPGIQNAGQTVNQSGIERIVFYFTRTLNEGKDNETKTIFDPMLRKGNIVISENGDSSWVPVDGNSWTYVTNKTLDDETFAEEDKLVWKKIDLEDDAVDQKIVTLSTPDPNVHKGGLAKINGIIYKITDLSDDGTEVTLSGKPGSASQALFAIANVIDNTVSEELPAVYSRRNKDYGFGYPDNKNWNKYDDGDLMPESFSKGVNCNWGASINSQNISDGKVELHYVVFDKAGNCTENVVTGKVQNNSPRIAGVKLGVDEDGNGKVEENKNEFVTKYSGLFAKGKSDDGKKVIKLTIPTEATDANPISVLKIKRKTVIQPEIVGGNGALGYTYSVGTKEILEAADIRYFKDKNGKDIKGTGEDETETVIPSIELDVKEFLTKEITDGEKQKFVFTIWDSTEGLIPGEDSQSAILNVIMDVALDDTEPAQNKIIPFYWKNKSTNSLTSEGLEKGHIELSKDLSGPTFGEGKTGIYTLNPKVSGAIKLEGIARDNNLLKNLKLKISKDDTDYLDTTIASYNTEGENVGKWTGAATIREATKEEYASAKYPVPAGVVLPDTIPYASQMFGHVVHWEIVIDTEALNITPAAGIVITAEAEDYGSPYKNGSYTLNGDVPEYNSNAVANNGVALAQTGGSDGLGDHTCKYTIDVVPYIRGIKTALSRKSKKTDSSEYDRSALGHYPVASKEQIYIYGFNIAGGKLYDKNNHELTYEVTVTTENAEGFDKLAKEYKDKGFNVYKTAALTNFTSGEVTVKVGTIESLNNKNSNNAKGSYTGAGTDYSSYCNFYNRKPNEANNNTLTDDVVLDVWFFRNNAAIPNPSGRLDESIMKINPVSNIIGLAFLSGTKRVSIPKGKTNSYSDGGDTSANQKDFRTTMSLAYDYRGWSYYTEAAGNEGDRVKFRVYDADGKSKLDINFDYINQKTMRDGTGPYMDLRYKVRSPSIATSPALNSNNANDTNIYMVYYDSYNDEIRYKYGTISDNGLLQKRKSDNADSWNKDNPYSCKYSQVIATDATINLPTKVEGENTIIDPEYKYTGTPLANAGEFVDIDVVPGARVGDDGKVVVSKNDVVVVVWYDAKAKALMYSYNTKPTDYSWRTTNTDIKEDYRGLNRKNWENAQTIFTNAGEFCQVKVDKAGGVHIAAYDINSKDLKYAYLSSYSATPVTYTVDSAGNVGSFIRMDVALDSSGNPMPYISYWGGNMAKIAFPKTTNESNGAVEDMYTGDWEISYIPTDSTLSDLEQKRMGNYDNRINVAVWKDAEGKVTESLAADGSTRKNEAKTGSGTCWGNGTANPVVSYSITNNGNDTLETAQMQ